MLKNTENQKWIVYAFDSTTGLAKTGDAAQITANLRKDYGDAAALTDTNPAELEGGFYAFDLSQAETNADHLLICPVSSTANIVVIGCPSVIFTEPTGRKYPATLAAADVSGNVPVDVAAIQSGMATAANQATIISAISGVPAAVWAVSTRTLSSFGTLVADIATAVWAYLTSALTVTGSVGKLLTDNIDATVSSRSVAGAKMDLVDAPNVAAVTAIQSGLALDSTVMKSADYTAPPSASDIASAVWSAVTRTLTAFSDSSGITTLLSRIGDALSITGGKVDINDKTGFALADGQAMTAAKVVIDNQNNTIKLYNVDDELIVTYTKTVDGSVHTLSRS